MKSLLAGMASLHSGVPLESGNDLSFHMHFAI